MPASADHRSSNISPCWTTPREASKVLYPLPEILLLLLCETVAGADDFVEIALWGNEHLDFLRPFLPYQGGIPIERQKRSYLCSTRLDVDSFARIVRGHWGIENRLYWVPDVVFRDDLARLRSGQYGHHQAHCQPAYTGKARHQLQEPPQEGTLEPRVPRQGHHGDSLSVQAIAPAWAEGTLT